MTAATPLIIAMYGISAAILWGSSDYLGANASKRNNPNAAILGVTTIGTLFFSIIFLFNRGTVDWNTIGVFYSIVAGASLSIGLLTFYRGLDAGPVNLVSPIGSAYPLVSLLIVLLIFGGSIKLLNIIGIVIVVMGIAIASGLLNSRHCICFNNHTHMGSCLCTHGKGSVGAWLAEGNAHYLLRRFSYTADCANSSGGHLFLERC
jgi:uncharacterized membrane protein